MTNSPAADDLRAQPCHTDAVSHGAKFAEPDRRRERTEQNARGTDDLRILIVLACVLGLGSADQGTLGAVAGPLENGLHIGNAEIGVLASVVSAIGLLTTVPAGALTDRVTRTRLLAVTILLTSAAMVANGAAQTYQMLLISRLLLGAVSAAMAPAVASLVGDYFPAHRRGRAYGIILAGELLGTGFGYVVAGGVAALLSWRWAFWVLAPIGFFLVISVFRLPEPRRGQFVSARTDEKRVPFRQAMRYVLSVRSNVILIVVSSLLYFFLAVLRTFASVFAQSQYSVGQAIGTLVLPLVGLGAVLGVLTGGRLGDLLLRAGHVRARILIGVTGYTIALVLFVPAFSTSLLLVSMPLFFLASAALGLLNPPLDAARLDVVHHQMWGRSEGVRTFGMLAATAAAPLTYGFLSEAIGMQDAFLAMLGSLALAAVLLVFALHTYPPDAAAAESTSTA